jgi:hypothetical protein
MGPARAINRHAQGETGKHPDENGKTKWGTSKKDTKTSRWRLRNVERAAKGNGHITGFTESEERNP